MAAVKKSKGSASDTGKRDSGSFGLFARMFSFFSGIGDPDREKTRLIKEIGKQLKKQRLRFYRTKTGEVLPGLARFFYDTYKVVSPAHMLIKNAETSSVLKSIVIEYYLSDEQREIQSHFDDASIRARSREIPPKDLAAEYKDYIVSFFSAFDNETARQINATYNLMDVFLHIINYDYFFLLKKFDSGFPEADFKYKPRFEAINGEYASDDLKDFMEIMPLVDERQEWQTVFEVLRIYKGSQIVAPAQWRSLQRSIMDIHRSSILLLMVQHIDGDPYFQAKTIVPNHKIVEDHLTRLKTRTEMTIQKVLNERRKSKIDELAEKVFGTSAVSRMRNYTDKANVTFAKKTLAGYTHTTPMNFLKAFLLDYLKGGEMKTTIDLLLIRGQWAATILSQQLSEAFHQLNALTDQLLQFDEALAEDGDKGAAVKGALYKVDRDKGMMKVLKQYLTDINGDALRIIKESAQNLIAVAKYLKSVSEDHKTKPPEMILNWREIESASEQNIDQAISSIYRKIYYFSQLLQYYLKN
jgi:hypothetical protein